MTPPLTDRQQQAAREAWTAEKYYPPGADSMFLDGIYAVYAAGMREGWNGAVDAAAKRMRERGFVLRQIWVHPKDWPRVKVYLARVFRERDK